MTIIRKTIVSALAAGSLLISGAAATAEPLATPTDPPSSSDTSPAALSDSDTAELIRQLDSAGYPKTTESVPGGVLHTYTNEDWTLTVPERDPNTPQPRIGGGWDWGGPYVSLNQSEQRYFATAGIATTAAAISSAFPPAAPFAAGIAAALSAYVGANGVCPGDMHVYFPSNPRCA
ncbi:hypothetical protein CH267_00040 [Rhodococcus sp. 06-621-2]|nr:hypothetical protein [Rhodococcus sp. 06-621-2]OZC62788.1 hypothetical protein CH267_00040 [Rhodococcus sp. 06-621-2]